MALGCRCLRDILVAVYGVVPGPAHWVLGGVPVPTGLAASHPAVRQHGEPAPGQSSEPGHGVHGPGVGEGGALPTTPNWQDPAAAGVAPLGPDRAEPVSGRCSQKAQGLKRARRPSGQQATTNFWSSVGTGRQGHTCPQGCAGPCLCSQLLCEHTVVNTQSACVPARAGDRGG